MSGGTAIGGWLVCREREVVEGAMETFLYLALRLEKRQAITGCWGTPDGMTHPHTPWKSGLMFT